MGGISDIPLSPMKTFFPIGLYSKTGLQFSVSRRLMRRYVDWESAGCKRVLLFIFLFISARALLLINW